VCSRVLRTWRSRQEVIPNYLFVLSKSFSAPKITAVGIFPLFVYRSGCRRGGYGRPQYVCLGKIDSSVLKWVYDNCWPGCIKGNFVRKLHTYIHMIMTGNLSACWFKTDFATNEGYKITKNCQCHESCRTLNS